MTKSTAQPVHQTSTLQADIENQERQVTSSLQSGILTLQATAGNSAVAQVATQVKLRVSQPDDHHEREADRIANQISAVNGYEIRESTLRQSVTPTITPLSSSTRSGNTLHRARDESDELTSDDSHNGSLALDAEVSAFRSGGRALSESERSHFEAHLGRDLSQVRIHTDSRAQHASETVDARAFTTGQHVVFGQGEYSPHSASGHTLLAHELVHTIQQRAEARPGVIARNGPKKRRQRKRRRRKRKAKKLKIVSVTALLDVDQVVLQLSNGETRTLKMTYNGNPGLGTYTLTRTESGQFASDKTITGKPNKDGHVVEWIMLDDVTKAGVKSYKFHVLQGTPGPPSASGTGGSGGKDKIEEDGADSGAGDKKGPGGSKDGQSEADSGQDKGTGKDSSGSSGGTGDKAGSGTDGGGGTQGPGEGPRLPADQEAVLREIISKMAKGDKKVFESPDELVRLYKILKRYVEDPVFGEEGEDWIRFARFLQENKDKIQGRLKGAESKKGNVTQKIIQDILDEYGKFLAVQPPKIERAEQLRTVEDYNKEFKYDPGWAELSEADRKLLLEYASKSPEELKEGKIEFKRITTNMKMAMALKLADTSFLGEMAGAAKDAFTDPRFLITLVVMMGIYVGLWLTPDPTFITKALAGILTVYLIAEFGWSAISGLAKAWSGFSDGCKKAKTVDELKAEGEKFLKRIGPIGFDVLLFIVMWRIGKRAGPKVQKYGMKRAKARAQQKLEVAEAQPGSGAKLQATGEGTNLLSNAKIKAGDSPTPKAILDALDPTLSPKARQGLRKLRSDPKVGDANALKRIEGQARQGRDLNHHLAGEGMTKAQTTTAKAEVLKAHAKLARLELIEIKAINDLALRSQARADFVNRTLAKFGEMGITKHPRVLKAVKNQSIHETTGALGEAISMRLLKGEYSSGHQVFGSIEIVRKVPHKTAAQWKAAEIKAGRSGNTGKLRKRGGQLYESLGEADALVAKEIKGGKLRIVEVEQVKTGAADKPSQAVKQNTKVMDGLQRVAAGEADVGIFQKVGKTNLGQEYTGRFDLSNLGAAKQTTRGPSGKGFSKKLPYDAAVLDAVAQTLVKLGGLPPTKPQPVVPVPRRRKKEEVK